MKFDTRGFYDNCSKKIQQNVLVKIVIKNSCVKFDTFSRRNGSFIFPKLGLLEVKVLIINIFNRLRITQQNDLPLINCYILTGRSADGIYALVLL